MKFVCCLWLNKLDWIRLTRAWLFRLIKDLLGPLVCSAVLFCTARSAVATVKDDVHVLVAECSSPASVNLCGRTQSCSQRLALVRTELSGCVPRRNLPGTIRFYWAADLYSALQFNFGPTQRMEAEGRLTKLYSRVRAASNGNLIFTRTKIDKCAAKKNFVKMKPQKTKTNT